MFTGIIEEIGTIQSIRRGLNSSVLTISAKDIMSDMHLGDSIAVSGVCLTVTAFTHNNFTVDVMHETQDRSMLKQLQTGSKVNLERALPANGRFGGHIVSGHIDGIGSISQIRKDDNAVWYTVKTTEKVLRYIVEKGSIALDGISLTVAKAEEDSFSVSVIPHTAEMTTLSSKNIGDAVNLENDCIGKYVEKLIQPGQMRSNITKEFLLKHGY